jgi:hypothetical protein
MMAKSEIRREQFDEAEEAAYTASLLTVPAAV